MELLQSCTKPLDVWIAMDIDKNNYQYLLSEAEL